MRKILAVGAFALLAACAAEVPDARGVGFGDNPPIDPEVGLPPLVGPLVEGGQISAESANAIDVTGAPSPSTAPPVRQVTTNNPGISDEQDFSAVASRESIESDRLRREAQQQAFQVVEPTALPTRRGNAEQSIVTFALSTNHAVGVSVYSRTSLSGQGRFDRNCAKYASPDLAQMDFLASGGPERDRKGIDPDGDGYACYWDPTPFRAALNQ